MANIILHNPNDPVVPGRVTSYLRSKPAADYAGQAGALIFDTEGDPASVAALISGSVPLSRWKVVGMDVEEWDQADIDAQAAADAAAAAAGVVTLTAEQKAKAKAYIDTLIDEHGFIIRALGLELLAIHNAHLVNVHSLPPVSAATLRDAVKTRIDNA